jgi:hypothetical protein
MLARFLSILSLLLGMIAALPAGATPHPTSDLTSSAPVYLKPYTSIPTGHYNVNLLKKNLVAQDHVRWVFVKTKQGQTGWALKHQLLNPLHFSTRARLLVGAPVFKERKGAVLPSITPTNEATVNVIDVQNEWIHISHQGQQMWTTTTHLFPIEKDAGYFFTKQDYLLTESPQNKSRIIKKLPSGSRLTPIEIKGPWVKVAHGNLIGFIPTNLVMSRLDIATKVKTAQGFEAPSKVQLGAKIYEIYVNPLWIGSGPQAVTLHQQPSASSSVMGQVKPWQSLLQQDSVQQNWAVSFLKELGSNVWWEVKDNGHELMQLTQLNLKDVRKVLPNPLFNNLKIAAAGGLFRSTDGVYWAPLKEFQGYNPAFTFSKNGVLFVEDKVSYDSGEHFVHYVMWERLLKSLRDNRLAVARSLKIVNVETLNSTSEQIILELDTGHRKTVKAYTADRGQTWSILKF